MKSILDEMEEHIAAIRNLQRNFDFYSKRLEKLMRELKDNHLERNSTELMEEQVVDETGAKERNGNRYGQDGSTGARAKSADRSRAL